MPLENLWAGALWCLCLVGGFLVLAGAIEAVARLVRLVRFYMHHRAIVMEARRWR